jgi:hypothetical protein
MLHRLDQPPDYKSFTFFQVMDQPPDYKSFTFFQVKMGWHLHPIHTHTEEI